jgi:hypothetical protein
MWYLEKIHTIMATGVSDALKILCMYNVVLDEEKLNIQWPAWNIQ